MELILLTYNNYYNRIVKRDETLTDYETNGTVIHSYETNFKEGDGINTQVIANFESEIMPDYAVLGNGDIVVSRWFIIDVSWIRKGQYQLTLHRDVIADNLDVFKNSTAFIEKATLPKNSILNFTNEDMTFNQIKVGEELLKDKTNAAWFVGYMAAPQTDETNTSISITPPQEFQVSTDSLDTWAFKNYINVITANEVKLENITVRVASNDYAEASSTVSYYQGNYIKVGAGVLGITTQTAETVEGYRGIKSNYNSSGQYDRDLAAANLQEIANEIYSLYDYSKIQKAIKDTYVPSDTVKNNLLALNGKVLRVGTSTDNYEYYNMVIENAATATQEIEPTMNNYVAQQMKVIYDKATTFSGIANDNTFKYTYTSSGIILKLYKIQTETDLTISAARPSLEDAPYCMFASPFSSITINLDGVDKVTDSYQTIKVMSKIYEELGAKCYDIQLLPYCPFPEMLVDGKLTLSTTDSRFASIGPSNNIYSFIYWCRKSTFTFNIEKEIAASDEVKVQNETEFIRFNSPNYAAAFDFSVAKNGGIDYINVDCSYKPYNPYIHLNPNFKGLYGADYNDARGLILSGDFSIPRVSDAWTEYQLQNKNFQASFDRSIESLEFQNKYSKIGDISKTISGTVQGAASGAMAGGLVGGPVGMGIGAAVSGVGSLATGITDIVINEKLRNESLDLTKDQFNFNNGSIKARPDTLQKVGALNANNKLFPFIEYYSATEEEKNILREKLKYNGMKVEVIDTISNYITEDLTFIKGQIIRSNLKDDYRLQVEISNEFNKGVYISE